MIIHVDYCAECPFMREDGVDLVCREPRCVPDNLIPDGAELPSFCPLLVESTTISATARDCDAKEPT